MNKKSILKFMNYWPPFLGAGIKIEKMSSDFYEIKVSMKLHFWNKNYVNTHYGGSLYSMTDPFYMLMLMQILGRDYIIWDKAASIKFKRPGKGKVTALFQLKKEDINKILEDLKTQEKVEPSFIVLIQDELGQTVAEVEKILHIKKK